MKNKIVIEVGVSDGYDTEKLINKFKLPIYGFEPVPYLQKLLNKKFSNYKNVFINEMAVDIENGYKDFYISNPDGKFTDGSNRKIHPYGCSSLHKFSNDIHEKWIGRPDFNVVEVVKVKTIRLDTFLHNLGFDGEISYLHCDAQGNDLNVLRSMGKYLDFVKEGVIEVANKTELYMETDNNLENAKSFLKSKGFNLKIPVNPKSHELNIYFSK